MLGWEEKLGVMGVFSDDFFGDSVDLIQQIYSTKFLRRPHTMVDVATKPPTPAHSLTRNEKNPSLSLVTSTLRAEMSYLK